MYEFKEQDWKLFRKKLPLWQEAYMDRLNQEYIQILSGDGCASDKFWKIEQHIRMDKRTVGVTAEMRRSQMYSNLLSLLANGIIQESDLEGFSAELTEIIKIIAQRHKSFAEQI